MGGVFPSREQPNVKVLLKSRGEKFGYIKKVGKKALWHRHSPWRRKVIRSSPAVAAAAASFRIKRKTYVPLREVTLVDTQQVVRTGLDSFAEFDFISPELVKELQLPVERRSVCMVEASSRNKKIRTFVKAFEIELEGKKRMIAPMVVKTLGRHHPCKIDLLLSAESCFHLVGTVKLEETLLVDKFHDTLKAVTTKTRMPHKWLQETIISNFYEINEQAIPDGKDVILSMDIPYGLQREEWDQETVDLQRLTGKVKEIFMDRQGFFVCFGSWEQVIELQKNFVGAKVCFGVKPSKRNSMSNRVESFVVVPFGTKIPYKDNLIEDISPVPDEWIKSETGEIINKTQKGLKAMKEILHPLFQACHEKGVRPFLIDAFAGTGTASVIALRNGIDFIAAEKAEKQRRHIMERLLQNIEEEQRSKLASHATTDKAPQSTELDCQN